MFHIPTFFLLKKTNEPKKEDHSNFAMTGRKDIYMWELNSSQQQKINTAPLINKKVRYVKKPFVLQMLS